MTEQEFHLDSIRLSGLTFGDPKNPVVLCLHGWLDNAASFIPLAPYLKDYYLVAIDFAGHGKSGHRPHGAHYHLLDNIQDIHELVLAQGWEHIIVLGHSMGGILGSIYTSAFPEKVTRLVAMESFGALTKEAESSSEQLHNAILSRIEISHKVAKHPDSMDAAVKARMMAGKMEQASASLLMQRNTEDGPDGLRWRTDRRLRTLSSLRLTEGQAQAFIEQVRCPWLTILGSKGFEKVKNNLNLRKDWIQDFHFSECAGGHHLHMDNPEPVAAEIIKFLNHTTS